jgi:hypothetical protein
VHSILQQTWRLIATITVEVEHENYLKEDARGITVGVVIPAVPFVPKMNVQKWNAKTYVPKL